MTPARIVTDPRRDPRDLRGIERFRLPAIVARAVVAVQNRATRWHVDRGQWDWQTEYDHHRDIAYALLREVNR